MYPPAFAIDLIWQAHQMHPTEYSRDCVSLLGHELEYQPWSNENDEKEEGKIEFTMKLWAQEFQDEVYRKS